MVNQIGASIEQVDVPQKRNLRICGRVACCATTVTLMMPLVAALVLWWSQPEAFASHTYTYRFTFPTGYAHFNSTSREWAKIPHVAISELTNEVFLHEYIMKRRPVIITGVLPHERVWSAQKMFSACRSLGVNFWNHYMAMLESIPEMLYPYIDRQLEASFGKESGVTLEGIIADRGRPWTLGEYATALKENPNMTLSDKKYRWILDYLWPPTIHGVFADDKHAQKCPVLLKRFRSMFSTLAHLLKKNRHGRFEMGVWKDGAYDTPKKHLYAGPANSRAYPLHQHGGLEENLLFMIAGKKRAVLFPPSEEPHLGERPELSTEFGDRAYHAEPFSKYVDLDAQPYLAKARGAEGDVHPGEVLYIPANTIHAVENLEDVVSVVLHLPAGAGIFAPSRGSHIEERDALEVEDPFDDVFSKGLFWRFLRSLPTRHFW